jgi:hypothetical protein
MRPAWIKIILSLAALWAVVGGVLWWLNARKPSPEKVVQYIEAHPLEGKSEARPNRALDAFWKSLTAAEKGHYFSLVVPRGLQAAIERFNAMEPQKRKREIEKAVKRLREEADQELPEDFDPALAKKFVDEGLKTFYRDASIEAKMDALPLLEELERSFKWRH